MFPKFIVVTTLTTPATPNTLEKNEMLEAIPANTPEDANQLVLARSTEWRKSKVLTNQFGYGALTVQSAVFVQQAPAPAAE